MNDIIAEKRIAQTPIEASAIHYCNEIDRFFLVSDETDAKMAVVYIMDHDGKADEAVTIAGINKINDLEAITEDKSGNLYFLTSQSFNKKGKQEIARKMLIKAKRNGRELSCETVIPLWDKLLETAMENPKHAWASFILNSQKDRSIDIEGAAFTGDTLLLGFKNPKSDNKAVIIGIGQATTITSAGMISARRISLYAALPLYDTVTSTFCGISAMMMHDNRLFGLATGIQERHGISEDVGLMWVYDADTHVMKILRQFTGCKPEGISYRKDGFVIVFDNGEKNSSQYMIVKAQL